MFELIGYIAGICTATSFIPQAIKTFRSKDVESLSLIMYLIFNFGMLCWVVYGVYLQSVQMVLFNVICLCFSLPILCMIIFFKSKKMK